MLTTRPPKPLPGGGTTKSLTGHVVAKKKNTRVNNNNNNNNIYYLQLGFHPVAENNLMDSEGKTFL
jgi:hypothetical protein